MTKEIVYLTNENKRFYVVYYITEDFLGELNFIYLKCFKSVCFFYVIKCNIYIISVYDKLCT